MKTIFKKIGEKKMLRYILTAFAVLAVVAAAGIYFSYQHHATAQADSLSAAQETMPVPQFGVNIGDYSDCMNGYVPDTLLGDSATGLWTPIGGGIETGVAGEGYIGAQFGAGDCIQAGIVNNASDTYTEDFRVGIRVAPGLSTNLEDGWWPGAPPSTNNTICSWSDEFNYASAATDTDPNYQFGQTQGGWQWTPWASQMGGTTQGNSVMNYVTDNGGIECIQIAVQTSTLPAGEKIFNPTFGITISHQGAPQGSSGYSSQGAQVTSQTGSTCYLDSPLYSGDPNPPAPFCDLENINNGGNFWSAWATLNAYSLDATPTTNNIPTTMNVSETDTTGSDNKPLYITFKDTGTWGWPNYNSIEGVPGTQSGTCQIDYNDSGIADAPASGDALGSQCSVTVNLVSSLDALVHTPSSFSIASETIPIETEDVTQTITYHPAVTQTVTYPCGSTTCTTQQTTPEFWVVSDTGGNDNGGIAAGQSYTFPLNSITAPATPGTYNEEWQLESGGTRLGTPLIIPITVGSSSSTGSGTIVVSSTNSVTGSPVPAASWDITAGPSKGNWTNEVDICDQGVETQNIICSGYSQVYKNQPSDNASGGDGLIYTLESPTLPTAYIGAYEFQGVRSLSIAKNDQGKGIINSLVAFSKDVFLTPANASTCSNAPDCYNSQPDPQSVPSRTLTSGSTIELTILWDPIATIGVSPMSWSPTVPSNGSSTTSVTITNIGAPGSTLTWTATTSTTSGGSWLSISPSSDSSPGLTNTQSNQASETAIISANPAGLSVGSYTGTIVFTGFSEPGKLSSNQKVTINVTINVTPPTCSGPSCTYFTCSSNVCEATSTPGAGSCIAACGGGSGPVAKCTPSSITLSPLETSQCVLDLNGTSQNATWSVVPGSSGSIGATSGVYTPSAAGTETVSGTLPDGTSAQTTINVTSLPTCNSSGCQATCNDPQLTANPTTIVVPESSNLSYGCSHVTQCQLTGGDVNVTNPSIPLSTAGTISGSATTTPSVTTTYTLTCVNGNYSSDSVQQTVQVNVANSSLCEQNPNGAGCPQQ